MSNYISENILNCSILHFQESVAKLGNLTNILEKITCALDSTETHIPEGKPIQKQNRKSQIYDNLVNVPPISGTSPTEVLREMLRHCGEDDIPVLSGRRGPRVGSFDIGSSQEAAHCLNTSDDYVTISALSPEVSDVSVGARTGATEINKSWNDILNAADGNNTCDAMNGEYIDLMSYIDEDPQNSSMEMEQNMNGSQMSISQISTIASSGYQSFGYSQSSSPVESSNQQDSRDYVNVKSLSSQHLQTPLSFSNPMYRQTIPQGSSRHGSLLSTPMQQGSSSSGSISSEEDASTVKHCSPIKHSTSRDRESTSSYGKGDALRNLAPKLSTSSSSESLQDHEHSRMSRSSVSTPSSGEPVKFSLDLHGSCPSNIYDDVHNSNMSSSSSSHQNKTHSYSLSRAPSRPHELPHTGSMDFSYMRERYSDNQLRRTATDSKISHSLSTPKQLHSDSGLSMSSRGQMTPEDSPHRKLSPSNAVHMGIRSVQRKIHDQEKTKQEVNTLNAKYSTSLVLSSMKKYKKPSFKFVIFQFAINICPCFEYTLCYEEI